MELFVYRWDYYQNTIYGASTNGRYVEISGFIPWEYVEGGTTPMKTLLGSKSIFVSKVPAIHRDAIIQFLSIRKLYQTGWITVENADINGKCIKCSMKQVTPCPRMDIPDLHIIAFDIEAYSVSRVFPNPEVSENNIICISTYSNQNGAKTFSGDESTFVGEFYHYILDADIVTGYNTHGFDWRYITSRHDIPFFSKYPNIFSECITKSWSSSAYKNVDVSYLSIPGIIVVDLYSYCNRSFKIDDYRLNTVGKYFDVGTKIDMPLEKMWTDYEKGELDDIIEYCVQDCKLVLDIIERSGMINDIMALSRVTFTAVDQLFTSGQQNRIRSMLKNECIKYNYVDNFEYNDSESYKGAYVIDPEPGMYDHCACMDFASLYPSIIIAENICYSTYRNGDFDKGIFGIIPNLVHRLVNERNTIRNDPSLKAYANALKVCANSIYGVFGTKGKLNLMPAASKITQVGRESLNKAVKYLNDHGYHVIYGDTDSCIYTNGKRMKDEEHVKIAEEVTKLFSKPMQMKFENTSKRFLVLGKKMYITLDYEDNIIYKGVVPARRDSSKFIVEFYKDVAIRIMKDMKFRDHCREVIQTISDLPRESFIMKKTYNGPYKLENYPLEVYNRRYGPLGKGEHVWVIVSYGTSLGDRLRPAESDEPIDYQWYLERLVNPIDLLMSTTEKVFRIKHNIRD
jgi:DNA polymerase delta subunit 1